MAAGKIEIINMALAHLGEAAIQSIDEGSAPSNAARTHYDNARRATLRAYHWSFATKVQRLARLDSDSPDFDYVYALPSDLLSAIRLLGDSEIKYEIRQKELHTNADEAKLEYIYDETDADRFDDGFVEAFAYQLASKLAVPVSGKADLMQFYMKACNEYIASAAALNRRENREPTEENRYVDAR